MCASKVEQWEKQPGGQLGDLVPSSDLIEPLFTHLELRLDDRNHSIQPARCNGSWNFEGRLLVTWV